MYHAKCKINKLLPLDYLSGRSLFFISNVNFLRSPHTLNKTNGNRGEGMEITLGEVLLSIFISSIFFIMIKEIRKSYKDSE